MARQRHGAMCSLVHFGYHCTAIGILAGLNRLGEVFQRPQRSVPMEHATDPPPRNGCGSGKGEVPVSGYHLFSIRETDGWG